jgi:hypothetical protein
MTHAHACGLLAPLCGLGGLGNAVASAIFATLSGWFVGAATWLLGLVGGVLDHSTTPPVTSAWFLAREHLLLAVAAPIALLSLVGGILHATLHGALGELWRTVLLRLPVALVLGAAGAGIVGIAVTATDELCTMLAAGSSTSLSTTLRGLAVAVAATSGLPGAVAVLAAGLVIVGSFLLWFELVVRAAAITIATAMLPLVFAASLWPPAMVWARRLVETIGGLIISKAVIVLVLSIALDAVAHAGSGPATAITGGAMLLLASLAPYAVLRLVPVAEAAATSHLESVRHRASAGVQTVSRHAASLAVAGTGGSVVPSIDKVGSNPVGMMPGIDVDLVAGTPLDPNVAPVRGPSPVKAIPASAGTHVWERDGCGPRLVWKPPGHVEQP